jgi:MFS family permease
VWLLPGYSDDEVKRKSFPTMATIEEITEIPHEQSPLLKGRNYGTVWSIKKANWSAKRPHWSSKKSDWSIKKAALVSETSLQEAETDVISDSPFLLDLTTFKFWLIFGPILLQYFVAMFDSFLMVSSHPIITSYFHASNYASWLSTAFMLTSSSLQPMFGRMSDMFGRKPIYMAALLIFCVGTAWCAGARSIGGFIAGRAVCGVGAGAMISLVSSTEQRCQQDLIEQGNIMVNDLVKINFRGTYQAYINLLYGGGAAAGAAFGGYLCDTIGWRLTFAGQIPLVLVVYAMAHYTLPWNLGPQLANGRHWSELLREFDIAGSFFLFLSVASLILGLNLGGNIYSWDSYIVRFSLATALISAVILLWVEKTAERPIMPLNMILEAPRANLVFSNFFTMIGSNHILFNAPLYFEAVHGESATVAGLRISLPALATTVCGVMTGLYLTWTGRLKLPQVIGAGCMLVGGIATSLLCESTPQWIAGLAITPPYAGQGFMFPATILGLVSTTPQEDQATMMSTLILWRNLGIVLGVAISSLVMQNALKAYLNMFVSGHDKQRVISRVRSSVRAVLELKGEQKIQGKHTQLN